MNKTFPVKLETDKKLCTCCKLVQADRGFNTCTYCDDVFRLSEQPFYLFPESFPNNHAN